METATLEPDNAAEEQFSDNIIFIELERPISAEEVKKVIKSLKTGKVHGVDGILNEFFVYFSDLFAAKFV